jgi:hypothetical protein
MDTYGEVEVWLHGVLKPRHCIGVSGQIYSPAALSWESAPGAHWTGGKGEPQSRADTVAKKYSHSCRSRTPAIKPLA